MTATLIEDAPKTTLEVPLEGDDPYVIVGTVAGEIFTGIHQGGPDDIVVEVRWAKLGETIVGIWDEDGRIREFFSFEYPKVGP
jgi:hypothetical protein